MNKPTGASPSRLLTPEEAIHYLALDKQRLRAPRESLRWLCRSKKLRFAKIGRYVRFRQEWLDEFIDRTATECAGILTSVTMSQPSEPPVGDAEPSTPLPRSDLETRSNSHA